MSHEWSRVPLGADSERWATRTAERLVLAVVHNVTSLTRLLDVIGVLDSDHRIQVAFTWTRSSPFTDGVEDYLRELGAITIPWEQAVATEFDLAITTSYGGDLHLISAPLITFSHGMGYNKIQNQRTKEPKNQRTKGPLGFRRNG